MQEIAQKLHNHAGKYQRNPKSTENTGFLIRDNLIFTELRFSFSLSSFPLRSIHNSVGVGEHSFTLFRLSILSASAPIVASSIEIGNHDFLTNQTRENIYLTVGRQRAKCWCISAFGQSFAT